MAKCNAYTTASILLTTFLVIKYAHASRDIDVLFNDSVSLNCATNTSSAIQWHHIRGSREYVYAGGNFYRPYKGRLRLDKDPTTGTFSLVIPNAKPEDAGLYECSEELTGQLFDSIYLTVKGTIPRELEVLVNDSVSLICDTNTSEAIQWHYSRGSRSTSRDSVYAGGIFAGSYKGRLRMDYDTTRRTYSLIIPNAKPEDAGLYECSEEDTGRPSSSAQLTVLDSSPVCFSNMKADGFIGPNTCNLQPEMMDFTCSVSFNGKPPQLTWRSINDSQPLNEARCGNLGNEINCNLTLRSDPVFDGSVFICETTKSVDKQFSCSTDAIKIQFLDFSDEHQTSEKEVNDNASCLVRSNQNLLFNWKSKRANQDITLSKSHTFVIPSPGFHKCYVEYSIRNMNCSAVPSVIYAQEISVAVADAGKDLMAPLLSVATIALILLIAIGGICIWKKIKPHLTRKEQGPIAMNRTGQLISSDLPTERQSNRSQDIILRTPMRRAQSRMEYIRAGERSRNRHELLDSEGYEEWGFYNLYELCEEYELNSGTLSYVQSIEENYENLKKRTDVSDHVIDWLRAEDVLDDDQEFKIKDQTPPERINLLYGWLKRSKDVSKYEKFLQVMEREDVGQQDVVNILKGAIKATEGMYDI